MRQIKIIIRKPGQDQGRPVVLGRLSSMLISVLVMLAAIAVLTMAFVFGYLVLALVFAALLIAIVVSLILGAFQNLRR